jgi:uncharacterized membrane protein YeaQ/YmgE (transglycosylase-associated protein family)
MSAFEIFVWVCFGAILGELVAWFKRSRPGFDLSLTLIGAIGAFIGGIVGTYGLPDPHYLGRPFDFPSLLSAIGIACLFLFVYWRMWLRGRPGST